MDITELARIGASIEVERLKKEIASILREFPGLVEHPEVITIIKAEKGKIVKKRRRLTAAQRKATSRRMKAYWKEQRAAKAKD